MLVHLGSKQQCLTFPRTFGTKKKTPYNQNSLWVKNNFMPNNLNDNRFLESFKKKS